MCSINFGKLCSMKLMGVFITGLFSAFNVMLCVTCNSRWPESSGRHVKKTNVPQTYQIRILRSEAQES